MCIFAHYLYKQQHLYENNLFKQRSKCSSERNSIGLKLVDFEGVKCNSKEAIVEPYTTATRNLMSIQFFNYINIDDAHLHLIGQGRINSLVSTEKYAVYEVKETMRVINGSSLFIDFPVDQVKKLGSYTCSNVYAASPTFEEVSYTDLPTSGYDNKFRVNNGSYLNIKV